MENRIKELTDDKEKLVAELDKSRKVTRQIENNILLLTGAILELEEQSKNDKLSTGKKSK